MASLLNKTASRAEWYLAGLERRPVAPSQDATAELARLDLPFPEDPTDPERVLEIMDEIGSPATVATAGGRYFGFVIGGSLPAALAANWLSMAWDQNGFSKVVSPAAVALENVAGRWVLEALGLPAETAVSFVTGTTMAHFSALAAARHHVLAQAGWDVEAHGLFGAPPVTVVVGEEAHPTVGKALAMLGMGRSRVATVPTDDQGRFRPEAMPKWSGPAIVCLQAGNVNTGAFDPVGEVCDLAHEVGAWVHVDGAFGLWAAASPELKHLTAGMEKADSWATDGHKWLNVPYDSGLAIVRRVEPLAQATHFSAAYLPDTERYTPESSRRARGIDVWAALLSLGRRGLSSMVERHCRFARRFAEGLRQSGYEILNDVVLNQVLVSFGDAETTRRVIAAIQDDGTCWCGSTVWHGRTAMRISVSSWKTTEADVERSLEAMIRIADSERSKR